MDNPNSPASPSLRETLEQQHATAREQLSAAWQLHVARIEELVSTGWREHVEHVIQERFGEITARVEEAYARDLETRVSELRQRLRRELGERLNQLLRRLWKSDSEADLYQCLLEDSSMFCRRAALFLVDGQILKCAGSRDFAADSSGQLTDTLVPLASAPALLSAVESKDTVSAVRSAEELSEQIAVFFGEAPDRKAAILPVVSRGQVTALLCADGDKGDAETGGLELMVMLAGAALDARAAAAPPPPAPAVETPAAEQVIRIVAYEPGWSQLTAEDREIHLRAQRLARVRVAEIRLYQAQAVRTGRAQKDLYSSLKTEIDAAREAFRLDFVEHCASMTDYLHLELVRALANDDASLLGPNYPGPLA